MEEPTLGDSIREALKGKQTREQMVDSVALMIYEDVLPNWRGRVEELEGELKRETEWAQKLEALYEGVLEAMGFKFTTREFVKHVSRASSELDKAKEKPSAT